MTHKTLALNLLVVALLLLGAALYLQQAFQSFSYDDEESFAYASWRVSVGEVPYRDFLSDQMPAFLYWGGLIVRLFGRSYVALRLATMLVVLLAAYLFYALNRELYGRPVALLSLALFLVEANIFHTARFFLSEAPMLLFSNAGLYAFVLGEKRGKRGYSWLASVLFGLAMLNKLFGALPLAGCYLYLLYAWVRERRTLHEVLGEGLALGVPALLLVGGVAVVFMRITPYFLTAVFEHHLMQRAELSRWQTIFKALDLYRIYVMSQPVAVGLVVLGGIAVLRRGKALETLALWQMPTALVFLTFTRTLMLRHMTYLSPAMTTLAAVALWSLLCGDWRVWEPGVALGRGRAAQRWGWGVATLAVSLVAVYPWAVANRERMQQEDRGSFVLADFVQRVTTPDEYVVADYAGVNFLAGRRTTYWAAGLSGVSTDSGQIRGEMLIAEMEKHNVAMVIIDTEGDHSTDLQDYRAYRRYVQAHYNLVDRHQGVHRLLEVYMRQDTMPHELGIFFGDELALSGARLVQGEVPSGDPIGLFLRWRGLRAMASDYQVTLRLVDGNALRWAQAEGVPLEGLDHHTTRKWEPGTVELQEHSLKVAAGTPPGNYYLTAEVSELMRPRRLVATGGTILPTGEVVIAPVRVLAAAEPVRPGTLSIAVKMGAMLSGGLELLGGRQLPNGIAAGRGLELGLFWYAAQRPAEDYGLEFRLMRGEKVVQRWGEEIAAEYPTSAWREGEVVFGRYRLMVEEGLAEGRYDLRVAAIARDGHTLGETNVIKDLAVRAKLDAEAVKKAITHPVEGVTFDGRIGLLGYDLSRETLKAGETVSLTLYWECKKEIGSNYVVFTHLLDGATGVVGQRDGAPREGGAPTSEWEVGDVVVDRYEIPLGATGAAAGELRLEIGLYDAASGARLALWREGRQAGEDHLILPTMITVKP